MRKDDKEVKKNQTALQASVYSHLDKSTVYESLFYPFSKQFTVGVLAPL